MCIYFEFAVPLTIGEINSADLNIEKERILRRIFQQYVPFGNPPTVPITTREFKVRAVLTVNNFALDFLALCSYHDFFAILFIILGIDQSWEWPPLFGCLSEAYSMRNFWKMFWHRLVYKSFNAHASIISSTIRIPQGTSFSRIFNNSLVFLLSAFMHATVTWKHESQCAWGRDMMFWCAQPLAFLLEGVVQRYWKAFRRTMLSRMNPFFLNAFERFIGYVWVLVWLMWCAPKRAFALNNCSTW